jgi:hypothetical protein
VKAATKKETDCCTLDITSSNHASVSCGDRSLVRFPIARKKMIRVPYTKELARLSHENPNRLNQ